MHLNQSRGAQGMCAGFCTRQCVVTTAPLVYTWRAALHVWALWLSVRKSWTAVGAARPTARRQPWEGVVTSQAFLFVKLYLCWWGWRHRFTFAAGRKVSQKVQLSLCPRRPAVACLPIHVISKQKSNSLGHSTEHCQRSHTLHELQRVK